MNRLLVVFVLVGCAADVDPPWQLDHDRIIAVRATPPRILAGERSEVDALIGRSGDHPIELVPPEATVVSPMSLRSALMLEAGRWVVTAPSAEQLAIVRAELALDADAPVPLTIGVAVPSAAGQLAAVKIVWLGESAENPDAAIPMINGASAPPPTTELVVGAKLDVQLAIEATDTDDVNWLTSCGTMHDYDLPAAYLRVEPADPQTGDLAVVLRTPLGGVAWRVWPIRAE